METIYNISQLNRNGASLLVTGEERRALQAFTQALQMSTSLASQVDEDQSRMMQEAEQQAQQSQQTRQWNEPQEMETEQMDQILHEQDKKEQLCCDSPSKLGCFITDIHIDGLEDERFFICDKAIVFHPSTISPFSHLTFYSAAILYNMALCYHRRYMSTRKALMQDMACRLYDGCCESMREYLQAVGSSSHKLLIIALNNQGQLFFDMSDKRYKIMAVEMTEIIRQSCGSVQEIQSELLLNILMCGTLLDAATAAA